ncbi:hypothetical protein [Paenibacillus sp. PSB04]|nr:hypothetical protein [Paenibacillus sp. PSB04]UYO04657.1 hypothetical protein K2F33_01070 [Paenibacillus sp. PSB04]
MIFLFVILLIALVVIISNQYASLKKMDALQQTLREISDKLSDRSRE